MTPLSSISALSRPSAKSEQNFKANLFLWESRRNFLYGAITSKEKEEAKRSREFQRALNWRAAYSFSLSICFIDHHPIADPCNGQRSK
jgi:hypothetical protein